MGGAKGKGAEHDGEEWCLKSWCVAPRALASSTVVAPLYASNLFQAFELSFFGLVCAKEMRRRCANLALGIGWFKYMELGWNSCSAEVRQVGADAEREWRRL